MSLKTTFATHFMAGEITYEYLGPLTYRATITAYLDNDGGGAATSAQDTVYLNWGDGTIEAVPRVNGPIGSSGAPSGELIPGTEIKKCIYESVAHTYPGALPFYVISIKEDNRRNGIINIANGNSDVVPFYLEDTLKYLPPELFEGNSSPILLNNPIDYANVLDTFYHNPNAFDIDGDSLYYDLVPCMQDVNAIVPQYEFPDQFPAGPNNNISINHYTGEFIWATPQIPAYYNIAIRIYEYREGLFIGSVHRDMLIIVEDEDNDPPQIVDIQDTCVYAGDTININIVATDPNLGDIVTIAAAGGPIQSDPSRIVFNSIDGNPANASFQWQTICDDIRPTDYQIVFKASDNHIGSGGTPVPLVDLETWSIRVVGPPPDSLYVNVVGNDIQLNWTDPYKCFNSQYFQYFSVWRKYGCENIDRLGCETGLEGTDYEMIADHISTYSYLDIDVDRGNIYSYRIVAHFGTTPQSTNGSVFNTSESIPSHEVCVELPLDLPVITNVSVEETSQTDGIIFIQWSKPRAADDLLDTIQDTAPYVYELYRSEGFDGTSFSLIETFTASTYHGFNDTLFYDSLLNTVENPYSYKVVFKANGDTMGETSIASSIFLSIQSSDQSLILSWQENVPWVNDTFTIFRYNENTLVFDSINITEEHSFIDLGLENDSLYCYKIRSKGKYFSSGLINPIINFSQETCGTPIDTMPPCAPNLVLTNDCEIVTNQIWTANNYQNRLSWKTDLNCANDVESYNVYFKAPLENSFSLIERETLDTFYLHQRTNSLAGCYYITAIDNAGNESTDADTLCVENCALYNLPNVFTPNGDGDNDYFIPFPGWRFVEKVEMKIFGRWGNLVFQTQNPAILWNGTDISGKELKDGIYLYNGFYYVRKLDGSLEQRKLPPNKRGGGFVHLIRSK